MNALQLCLPLAAPPHCAYEAAAEAVVVAAVTVVVAAGEAPSRTLCFAVRCTAPACGHVGEREMVGLMVEERVWQGITVSNTQQPRSQPQS